MLILVRHGRTASNASGLLQGRIDTSLDEMGIRQAEAVAKAVGSVDRVVSSPLLRARQTADAFGAPVIVDERWIELDYGEWDGEPISSIPGETWLLWRSDPEFNPPGGESLTALGRRVREACAEFAELATKENVVVVSHVSPIKSAVCWALGVDDAHSWNLQLSTGSLSRVRIGSSGPVLVSFNEVP